LTLSSPLWALGAGLPGVGYCLTLVIDSSGVIKQLSVLDPCLGIRIPIGTRGDIDYDTPRSDCVVISHCGLIAKRANATDVDSLRHRIPGFMRFFRNWVQLSVIGFQKAI